MPRGPVRSRHGDPPRRLAAIAVAAALAVLPAIAGTVDLDAAECSGFPPAGVGVAVMNLLHEDGTAEDCQLRANDDLICAIAVCGLCEGVFCADFTAQPDPGGNHAEGPASRTTSGVRVDAIPAPRPEGDNRWNVHRDFGSVPPGEDFDVVVDRVVGERVFTATLHATGIADTSIEIRSMEISCPD